MKIKFKVFYNKYLKPTFNIAGICTYLGLGIGLIVALLDILANRYFHYQMYMLILLTIREYTVKWILLVMVVGIFIYVFFLIFSFIPSLKSFKMPGIYSLKHRMFALGIIGFLFVFNLAVDIYIDLNTPKAPNVILISIDALRADHLGCYGYYRNTSPYIDAFAEESIVFENAIVPRPKTTPSMVSLMTGLYPHTHMVRELNIPMSAKHNTLSEYLKNYHFHTTAFVCNWVLKDKLSGLADGFDTYDERMSTPHYHYLPFQRIAEDLNKDVYQWLETKPPFPFFLWLHYMDPHGPYEAPESFEEYSYDQPFLIEKSSVPEYILSSRLDPSQIPESKLDANALIAEYDKEIRYCDHYIGNLVKKLKEFGLYNNSLIIITSDHGESLIEHHYYFDHGKFLYDVCSRIPLLIKFPKINEKDSSYVKKNWLKNAKGKRITDQVCLIDIMPTVMDIINYKELNFRFFEGRSLLPLIKEQVRDTHKYVFIEKGNQLKAVRTNKWKYVEYNNTLRILGKIVRERGYRELFNLKNDPYEQKNLWNLQVPGNLENVKKFYSDMPVVRKLKQMLKLWKNENDVIRNKHRLTRKIDKKTQKALKSLGYLD